MAQPHVDEIIETDRVSVDESDVQPDLAENDGSSCLLLIFLLR